MKKLIRLFLMSLAIGITSIILEDLLIAQEPVKNKVNIKKIFEKTFDEEIEDVVFGKTKMQVNKAIKIGAKGLEGKKLTEEVEVYYPKVVVTRRIQKRRTSGGRTIKINVGKVRFLNKDGKIIKEISLDTHGKPIERIEVERIPESEEVYHNNTAYLLKSGKVFIVNSLTNWKHNLFLYNENGNLVWTKEDIMAGPLAIKFSENERYIFLYPDLESGEAKGNCLLYDIDGRLIWTREQTWKVELLNNGKAVVAPDDKTIHMLDTNNTILWTYSIPSHKANYLSSLITTKKLEDNFIIVKFRLPSKNKKKLLDEKLIVFNEHGKLLWEKELEEWICAINSFDKELLLLLRRVIDEEGFLDTLVKLDLESGELLWSQDVEGGEFTNIDFSLFDSNYFLLYRDAQYYKKFVDKTGKIVERLFDSPEKLGLIEKPNYIVILDKLTGKIKKQIQDSEHIFPKFINKNMVAIRKKNSISIITLNLIK